MLQNLHYISRISILVQAKIQEEKLKHKRRLDLRTLFFSVCRVFHLTQDSRTGCIALRLGHGKVCGEEKAPLTLSEVTVLY